jgi:hypothetical protein
MRPPQKAKLVLAGWYLMLCDPQLEMMPSFGCNIERSSTVRRNAKRLGVSSQLENQRPKLKACSVRSKRLSFLPQEANLSIKR